MGRGVFQSEEGSFFNSSCFPKQLTSLPFLWEMTSAPQASSVADKLMSLRLCPQQGFLLKTEDSHLNTLVDIFTWISHRNLRIHVPLLMGLLYFFCFLSWPSSEPFSFTFVWMDPPSNHSPCLWPLESSLSPSVSHIHCILWNLPSVYSPLLKLSHCLAILSAGYLSVALLKHVIIHFFTSSVAVLHTMSFPSDLSRNIKPVVLSFTDLPDRWILHLPVLPGRLLFLEH